MTTGKFEKISTQDVKNAFSHVPLLKTKVLSEGLFS